MGFVQEGFEVVFANEYDESIAAAFKQNHPSTIVDTTDISLMDLEAVFGPYAGKVDVVMGGPPCQGFSQKGPRVGINDERNFLFRQFIKVVEIIQPEFILLENVPNILSAANGYFKEEIIGLFSELGYDLAASVLKAENFGVPQTRRRAVFLGQKSKLKIALPTDTGIRTTVSEAIDDLPVLKSGEGAIFVGYTNKPKSSYQKMMRKDSNGIWNHIATDHSEIALKRLSYITAGGTKENLPAEHRTKSIHSGTWSRLSSNGFARTITTRFDTPSSGQFTLPEQDRCITVREAARLQSFPDTFIFSGTKSCQMIQVGNAVPPLVAKAIAKKIKKYLKYLESGMVADQISRRKEQVSVMV